MRAAIMNDHSPTPLSPLIDRLQDTLDDDLAADFRDSVAANTWRAYRSDLVDYGQWSSSAGLHWSTPATVAAYLRALEDAGAAYATIERRKTAIAKLIEAEGLHQAEPVEDPTKHPKVAVTLKAIRRRIGTDHDQAAALTADRLIQVLLAIDDATLTGRRDIALLLVGFYGGFRRSELAGMRRHHLDIDDNGVAIRLPSSKGSQDKSVWVPIHRQPTSRWDPLAALEDWLTAVDIHTSSPGVVWPRLTKGDTVYGSGPPISGDAINNLVIRRATAAGLQPVPRYPDGEDDQPTAEPDQRALSYSAHSLRAGFITEAKNRGVEEADIMKHTRHKSIRQMRSYDRGSWWNRNATATMAL